MRTRVWFGFTGLCQTWLVKETLMEIIRGRSCLNCVLEVSPYLGSAMITIDPYLQLNR